MKRSMINRTSQMNQAVLQALESRRMFSIFTVTTVADSGAGSLRQAILDSNANGGTDEIHFSIGTGIKSIKPLTALPRLDDAVIIDGTTQPGYAGTPIIEINGAETTNADGITIFFGDGSTLKGLVINRFDYWGVRDVSAGNNTIKNCYIGTNVAGNADLGNGKGGISLFSKDNQVGGPNAADRNVVSGNGGKSAIIGPGIQTTEAGGGNVIEGNYVGVAANGTTALGNASVGVYVTDHGTTVRHNVIAYNGSAGVSFGPNSVDNLVTENSIFGNVGLGIDVRSQSSALPDGATANDELDEDEGSNHLQNKPTILSAVLLSDKITVTGSLASEPNKEYHIELFTSPNGDGEGKTFVTSIDVTTDEDGDASFSIDLDKNLSIQYLTATATDPENNTSEFSNVKPLTVGPIVGHVFADLNGDGKEQSSEDGLANFTVYLDTNDNGKFDKNEKTAKTNSSGDYTFPNLIAGTYHVRAITPKGWRQTAPKALSYNRTLPGPNGACDFGFTNRVTIKGTVFFDANNNHKQESGEQLSQGVKVYLDADKDGKWDAGEKFVLSDSNGAYRFAGLKAGTYRVRVQPADNSVLVTAPPNAFYEVSLKAGESATKKNFGIFSETEIPE